MTGCGGNSHTPGGFQDHAVKAYGPFSPWTLGPGRTGFVPLETTEYETTDGMHDDTVHASGTASGGSTSTLVDAGAGWTVDEWAGYVIKMTGGTASGLFMRITSNTADTITFTGLISTAPDATTTYEISKQSRLVAPADGIYQLSANYSAAYQIAFGGILFYINNAFKSLIFSHQSQAVEFHTFHSVPFEMSEDDYAEFAVYNGGGAEYAMFGGQFRLWFAMHKIAEAP